MCVWLQAALQAGLGRAVSNVVTAVMEECVTLQLETVPVVWAGLVHAAKKVSQLDICSLLLYIYDELLHAKAKHGD